MIDLTHTSLGPVAVHQIGNKTNGEPLQLSRELLKTDDEPLAALLGRYFLSSFKSQEFHTFSFSNGDFTLNPVYVFASAIFDDPSSLLSRSEDIARHLFESSLHPQIKAGDLFVCYFPTLRYGEEQCEAVGIFKSETKQDFIKLTAVLHGFDVSYDGGIDVNKLDKGCLILNVQRDQGYKVCVAEKANKGAEAQFWRETFLQIKPFEDAFHFTKEFLSITKDYVSNQMGQEYHVSKADQIDLLNRSVNFFKENEHFDKEEFETEVFKDQGVIASFRNFDEQYRTQHEMELQDQFEISKEAVKKQSRVFKSILKLDKNFSVYIHGDRSLIERGTDSDGRNYYKIFFEQEK